MFLDSYFTDHGDAVSISKQQASDFAKFVAHDFNPIHDPDAKRFCVPGDLLFAIITSKIGLRKSMNIAFSGMVTEEKPLRFARSEAEHLVVTDDAEKTYLKLSYDAEKNCDLSVIEPLVTSYVQFSGKNFPHILVPLMEKQGVMLNVQRPLVMYESMALSLDTLELNAPVVTLADSKIEVNGKRGSSTLYFDIVDQGKVVGSGKKHMLLSGLIPYEQQGIDDLVAAYELRKQQLGLKTA
ncbi:hypothetical protein VST7929_03102 [Vibrio stylophorae]|uniref:DUF3581 domain-containing protein n=1 Tax=Vibrio stylophorae TaxID=659351 RepID=A0ABN8DZ39_9VIBR|nr:DUF3581 family protein [Vibrio stylophorae]CAH0535534.1 hypothetical protein VST7929_03102 [Vibrio stylophorae]